MRAVKTGIILFEIALLAGVAGAQPEDWYCDPVNGSGSYDGKSPTVDGGGVGPWGSFSSIIPWTIKQVSDGDTIHLLNGNHGDCDFDDVPLPKDTYRVRSSYVTVQNYTGHSPSISRFSLRKCAYWKFVGITFSPARHSPTMVWPHNPHYYNNNYLTIISASSDQGNNHIWFEDCHIYTHDETSWWDLEERNDRGWTACRTEATYVTFKNCMVRNCVDGLLAYGYSTIENCTFLNCNGDRAFQVGNGTNSTITGCWGAEMWDQAVDNWREYGVSLSSRYHHDWVQHNVGGTDTNLTIQKCFFCEVIDEDSAAGAYGQGILLSGTQIGTLIENNVVLVESTHIGITHGHSAGLEHQNVTIRNNTVAECYPRQDNDHPEIEAQNCESGTGYLVINNFSGINDEWGSGTFSNNVSGYTYDPDTSGFRNYPLANMRQPASGASHIVDQGTNTNAATEDHDGNARPYDSGTVDIGAFEYQGSVPSAPSAASSPSPSDDDTGVSVDVTLSWTGDGSADFYLIWLGQVGKTRVLYYKTTETSRAVFDSLWAGTEYHWRVDTANKGDTTKGPVWSFTTAGTPPSVPAAPTCVSPADGDTGIDPAGTTLQWSTDGSKCVVFCGPVFTDEGTDHPTDCLVATTTDTSANTGALEYSTEYCWRCDAYNEYGTVEGETRTFKTLDVPQNLPYGPETFDSLPDGADGWGYYSTDDGRISRQHDGGDPPDYRMRMDDTRSDSTYSYNEAVLHVNCTGYSNVTLTCSHPRTWDTDHAMSETFVGRENTDGIALSTDGENWVRIISLTTTFTDQEFGLDDEIATAKGLAGSDDVSNVRIKFQQYDNNVAPSDGREFDDISVTGDAGDSGETYMIGVGS